MYQARISRIALALVTWAGLSSLVFADDWMVDRLRGEVLVLVGDAWSPLRRGDVVSDSSRIRSVEGSRVTFTRGAEAIELSGATEIRIFDQQGERMTTIMQAYGTVTVEAERLQIQHFSVQTPFLAAIVKGTRFTVNSNSIQSSVDVERGLVQVQDYTHGVATDIMPGQSAVVSDAIVLDVSGAGQHAPLVTLEGKLLSAADEPHGMGQGTNPGNGNAFGHDIAASHSNGNGQGNNGNGGQGNGNGGQGNGNGGQGNGNGGQGNGNGGQGNGNGGQGNNGNGGQGNGNGGQGNGNNGQGNSGNSENKAGGPGNSGQGNKGHGKGS